MLYFYCYFFHYDGVWRSGIKNAKLCMEEIRMSQYLFVTRVALKMNANAEFSMPLIGVEGYQQQTRVCQRKM